MSDDPIRCPYCIQDDNFRRMKPQPKGQWFACEMCGHIVMRDNADFQCRCRKCEQVSKPLRDGVA
jgi:rubrerythrin